MALLLHKELPPFSTLLAGREPRDEYGFQSERLQIWYNHTEKAWQDSGPHAHTDSDEIFLMLEGALDFSVMGERRVLRGGEYVCFGTDVLHHVERVTPPVLSFMLRAPSIEDKVLTEDRKEVPDLTPGGFIHQDLPERSAWLVGPRPDPEIGFVSGRIQIRQDIVREPTADPHPHYHTESDEIIIVDQGAIHIKTAGTHHHVRAGEYICFPSGLVHQLIAVEPPLTAWTIRAPAVDDKVIIKV